MIVNMFIFVILFFVLLKYRYIRRKANRKSSQTNSCEKKRIKRKRFDYWWESTSTMSLWGGKEREREEGRKK